MSIALCIITKNEEKCLEQCIKSIKEIVNEIVVVDTGSTDDTIKIAKKFDADVYEFEWINDFSKARNYAIEKVKSEWIIFLDADEYLKEGCAHDLKCHIKKAQVQKKDAIFVELINLKEDNSLLSTTKSIRIFKKSKDIVYIKSIHEHIIHLSRDLEVYDASKEIKLYHTGYTKENIRAKDKVKRNIELLLSEAKLNPTSSDINYYLAESLMLDSNFEEALKCIDKVDQFKNSKLLGVYQKNKYNKLRCLVELNKDELLVVNTYKEAIKINSNFPDYEYEVARYYMNQNQYIYAISYLENCISKMNVYNSFVESACISAIEQIFEVTAKIYFKLDNLPKVVSTLVNLLKCNKYNVYGAYQLTKVLCQNEKVENVYQFLVKIYDRDNIKDMLFMKEIANKLGEVLLTDKFSEPKETSNNVDIIYK